MFSVLLGSRCNLTSNKPTLFDNHTMVLLYIVRVIINQFSAHLSFPVTRVYSLTRNFLKFVYITPKAQNKPSMTVINQPPNVLCPYAHLLASGTGVSCVPTYDQPPLIQAGTHGWKFYSRCVNMYFKRWNHRNPVI